MTAVRFALDCLTRNLLSRGLRQRLHQRLVEMASTLAPAAGPTSELKKLRSDLRRVQADIEKAETNYALADPGLLATVGKVLSKLQQQQEALLGQIKEAEALPVIAFDADAEVAAAMSTFDRLEELGGTPDDLAAVGRAFGVVNLRIFLRFEKRLWKKRLLDKVAGGVVTFGDVPPPVRLYSGPTGRKALKEELAASTAASPVGDGPQQGVLVSGEEGNSLGILSRGDRI